MIPVQLQILFARLLLLNQQSCGVDGLISSFGWTNNEVLYLYTFSFFFSPHIFSDHTLLYIVIYSGTSELRKHWDKEFCLYREVSFIRRLKCTGNRNWDE